MFKLTAGIIFGFIKAFFLILVLCVLNPHRASLMVVQLTSVVLSWLAWRLEDFAGWLDKFRRKSVKSWFIVGEPIANYLRKTVEDLDKKLKKAENKIKPADEEV